MKKQNKTFAARARAIEAKYKRAKFDPTEKAEMEAELETLMQEQEAFREAMGFKEQQQMQQYATGGKLMMQGDEVTQVIPEEPSALPGGYSKGYTYLPGQNPISVVKPKTPSQVKISNVPPAVTPVASVLDPSGWNNVVNNIALQGPVAQPVAPGQTTNGFTTTPARSFNTFSDNKYNNNLKKELVSTNLDNKSLDNKEGFWDKNKGYLPYALAGINNLAGNLLLANEAKKTPRINPVLATPERMNLEPQAEQMRKEASVSKNVNMRNARNLGQGATGMGVINSSVDRGLGDQLTKLYGQQEGFNAEMANRFALENQQAGNRANMFNAQMKQRGNEARLGFLNDAVGTIPGVTKDIRMDKADKEMRDIMNTQAKNTNLKNYKVVGDLFTKNGITFEVKEVDAEGNITKSAPVKESTKTSKKTGVLGYTPLVFPKQKFNTNRPI